MVDTPTTTYGLLKPQVGASSDTWGATINADLDALDDLLDGTTAIAPNLTASAWKVGGVAVTATAADLNNTSALNGITATPAELNYVAGVTSAIQGQINAKAPLASPALTGTPTAPTATAGTNTTQLATTAFAQTAAANAAASVNVMGIIASQTTGAVGTSAFLGTDFNVTYELSPNSLYAGTGLRWAGVYGNNQSGGYTANGGLVGYGTWRCMGGVVLGPTANFRLTEFLRVS